MYILFSSLKYLGNKIKFNKIRSKAKKDEGEKTTVQQKKPHLFYSS